MRQVPDAFAEQLRRVFDGRLRARWSIQRGCWHIEAQVGRKADWFMSGPAESNNDTAIRLQDGYALVCEVCPGDRMPCKNAGCMNELRVPLFEFGFVYCLDCIRRGYSRAHAQHTAGYFDLNERLIDYLRMLDPLRDNMRRELAAMDLQNKRVEEAAMRDALNQGEAGWLENYNRLVGIPQAGYSGATAAWKDAPESPGVRALA